MKTFKMDISPEELDKLLSEDVKDVLELPRRTLIVMIGHTIITVGQAVRYSPRYYRNWNSRSNRSFSITSLSRALEDHGLMIGMKVPIGPLERERLCTLPISFFASDGTKELKELDIETLGDFLKHDLNVVVNHLARYRSHADALDLYIGIRANINRKAIPI